MIDPLFNDLGGFTVTKTVPINIGVNFLNFSSKISNFGLRDTEWNNTSRVV
jgi:hypothetical protein